MYPNINPGQGPNIGFNPNPNQSFNPGFNPGFNTGFNPCLNTGYISNFVPDHSSNLHSAAEMGNVDNNFGAFSSKAIRMAFIRKVYGILSIQLLITFASIFAFKTETFQLWVDRNHWALIVMMVVGFGSMIFLACCQVHRTYPLNFIILGLFTIAMAFLLGMTTSFYRLDIVFYAIIITSVVVIGLTIFATQTKIDFTVYNGILFVGILVLLVMGILMMFFTSKIMYIFYSSLGALLFSAYLVVDTQMIVGGTHKYEFSPEDYIFASITLYTDIINLFTYILQLLNATKD